MKGPVLDGPRPGGPMRNPRSTTRRAPRSAALLLVAACFTGDGLVNQPCQTDKDCNPVADVLGEALRCVHNICGYSPSCGDGIVDGDEECDDDNSSNEDACTNICRSYRCGDGFVQEDEECDDGNDDPDDSCDGCRQRCGDVDILFVIDDSISMGEEQARLAGAFSAFVTQLAANNINHYRIGFTTTDVGNPRCPQGIYSREDGDLVVRSCRDRLDAFQVPDQGIDETHACTEVCALTGAQLELQASTVSGRSDGKAKQVRPWIVTILDGEAYLDEPVLTFLRTRLATSPSPEGIDVTWRDRTFLLRPVRGTRFREQRGTLYNISHASESESTAFLDELVLRRLATWSEASERQTQEPTA